MTAFQAIAVAILFAAFGFCCGWVTRGLIYEMREDDHD
jgi:hypothetical protein